MSRIEISGIGRIPSSCIHITSASASEAEALTTENALKRLPEEKLHATLLHQATKNLNALSKLVRKFLKGKLDSDPVVYPKVELPQIDTEGAEVVLVEDQNPKTGEGRKTVRIVLRQELQTALSEWVAEFCELNSLERDDVELQRVYHISYANYTGLPGDSVR